MLDFVQLQKYKSNFLKFPLPVPKNEIIFATA